MITANGRKKEKRCSRSEWGNGSVPLIEDGQKKKKNPLVKRPLKKKRKRGRS